MKTKVIFKTERDGSRTENSYGESVLAVFPETMRKCGRNALVTTYASVGQHSEASVEYVRSLAQASPAQYAGLKRELESIGYEIDIQANLVAGA